jgi:hypothetical protein
LIGGALFGDNANGFEQDNMSQCFHKIRFSSGNLHGVSSDSFGLYFAEESLGNLEEIQD